MHNIIYTISFGREKKSHQIGFDYETNLRVKYLGILYILLFLKEKKKVTKLVLIRKLT